MLSRIKFRNKIVIGIKKDSKPFGFTKNGELAGFDVDVAKNIAKRLLGDDNLTEFVDVTADSRISDLN